MFNIYDILFKVNKTVLMGNMLEYVMLMITFTYSFIPTHCKSKIWLIAAHLGHEAAAIEDEKTIQLKHTSICYAIIHYFIRNKLTSIEHRSVLV